MVKSIIANLINICLIIIVIVLVRKLPAKAQTIKELENQKVLAQENIDLAVLNADIERNREKIDKLGSLIANQNDVLIVIEALSRLKSSGQIQEFNIADNSVKDGSGQMGLPIFIKGSGNLEAVDLAISNFHKIGKIIKPVKLNLRIQEENITFEYTGFLLMQ